jgi:N-acetylglucosamine transport system substrate-binding protein
VKKISRREFLKATALYGGAAAASAALAACGPAATPAPAPAATSAPAATAVPPTKVPATSAPAATAVPPTTAPVPDFPFKVAPEALNPFKLGAAEVDGQFFSGGYGHEYIKYTASLMEKEIPGVKVGVVPLQRVNDVLRPRFVGGNPPDVIDNSGAGMMDVASLVADGQLADLAELMEAPAFDTPGKKVKETLIPGTQDTLVFDGKQRGINFVFSGYGICYSQKLFKANGWKYPATWEDMIDFSLQLKKDGKIAPWTHQAKYPYYIQYMVLWSLLYSAGGNDLLVKIDNLEPNIWKDPAVLRAAEGYYQLYDKDLFLAGTAGLDHTASQTEFYKGNAAFIPCGGWLENEMKTILPADFDTVMAICPPFKDSKGNPKAAETQGGEGFIVPEKAKNKKHGFEFLRILMSKAEAKYFAENVLSISAVIGGLEGAKASSFMKSQVDMATNAGGDAIIQNIQGWYDAMWKGMEALSTQLLTGKIKPPQFCDAVQKLADQTAKDPDIKKYKRTK